MEKDLIAVKKSISIVSADKDINDIIKDMINQPHDCFARAYLEGNGECRQCVIIAEFRDFDTGDFRREPLWVACFEACRFLSGADRKIEIREGVTEEMQEFVEQTNIEQTNIEKTATEITEEIKPEVQEQKSSQGTRPRKKSVSEGHSKTLYCTCSKCGKKVGAYESTFNNRLREYGSLEEMNKKYLCKRCRKEVTPSE